MKQPTLTIFSQYERLNSIVAEPSSKEETLRDNVARLARVVGAQKELDAVNEEVIKRQDELIRELQREIADLRLLLKFQSNTIQ